jgi:photosystem II stability/assembly factor-like uncharacterized protein
LFSEDYFPEPGLTTRESPGGYPGPFSVISDDDAVFFGNTSPIPASPMSLALYSDAGATAGPVRRIASSPESLPNAASASFTSVDDGWLVASLPNGAEILHTADGGTTWSAQLTASG